MNEFGVTAKLMGSIFELIVGCTNADEADILLTEGIVEIQRIEELLSEFKADSYTSQINASAGIHAVKVDRETFALVQRCQRISSLTQGAFDLTVGPMKKLYRFQKSEFALPSKKEIDKARALVGFSKIMLNDVRTELFLPNKGMHISFAAIGKGYAADCVKKRWLNSGVTSGVISASGDLTTIGTRWTGEPWQIGIADPDQREQIILQIPLNNSSIATSGDYEQFFMYDKIRYSHTIHPVTGLPVTGIKSVSIIGSSAELCDALATAVFVMGVDVGIHFLNQIPHTHGIVIDHKNKCHYSDKIVL